MDDKRGNYTLWDEIVEIHNLWTELKTNIKIKVLNGLLKKKKDQSATNCGHILSTLAESKVTNILTKQSNND